MESKRVLLTLIALLAASTRPAAAQSEDQPLVVPLSDPGRPAVLEVSLFSGDVSVTAYDGDEVVVAVRNVSEGLGIERPRFRNDSGLRRIPNASLGLTVEERGNTVSVNVQHRGGGAGVDISVPRLTSVRARGGASANVTVQGVSGEHELSNMNGSIEAVDIAGSAVVSTTNGDVQVSFTEITPEKAMSFTTFNGNVEVTFPEDLSADLLIQSNRGEVLTDFDFELRPQTATVDQSDGDGRYRVRLERAVRAVVGNGGPEMHFKTFNGDIVIRRR